MPKKTIHEKRKERVKITAEVFTPKWLAQEMLDKIPQDFWEDPDKTLLEPSCGDGIFVELSIIKRLKNKQPIHKAIHNTYGIDIMEDNIKECRKRIIDNIILKILNRKFEQGLIDEHKYNNQLIELCSMVIHNIRKTDDTLKENFDEWKSWNEEPNPVKNAIRRKIKRQLKDKNLLKNECEITS
jgi:hypothetical protein